MSEDSLPQGVIYTAIGKRYAREAAISAASVKEFLTDTPILLFTNVPLETGAPFDDIVMLNEPNCTPHLEKLACMKRSPFRKTLFLDTDTFVCDSPADLFDLIERFDVAMSLDRRYFESSSAEPDVPSAFCEFNQGVIAFRQSPELREMLQRALDWARDFERRTGTPTDDQVAMRIALYRSTLRIATLPQEFNCRFHSFGYLNGTVKILHARVPGSRQAASSLRRVAGRLNRTTVPRVFVGGRLFPLGRRLRRGEAHYFAKAPIMLFRPWYGIVKTTAKGWAYSLRKRLAVLVRARW